MFFCSLGQAVCQTECTLKKIVASDGGDYAFDFISWISVYFFAPNFEKSTQYFYIFRKGMVEHHDKG